MKPDKVCYKNTNFLFAFIGLDCTQITMGVYFYQNN